MTRIYYEAEADLSVLDGRQVAVVGYGNQGRSWALNLRDSGVDAQVCVRDDASRALALAEGFAAAELEAAADADVICLLVPDDAIPTLPIRPRDDALTIVASGYTLAFGRFDPAGDQAMVAPRMLGPEVRRCFEEGWGFITGLGVHKDVTGTALARTLAVALGIGGLRQGAIEMSPRQEAVVDLAVEQVRSPALAHVNEAFVRLMLENDVPLEAIITELMLSGEVERSYALVRQVGFVGQLGFHSPTSQYGQLSRRGAYADVDLRSRMAELLDEITSGRFADEWDEQRDAGHPRLAELWEEFANDDIAAFELDLRRRLGEKVTASGPAPAGD
ncbi:MAG: NAD(P)-binding domain-containing protein [Acidimicrobiales bacterium]|jgi:ketol-acid reductoisomerase|nr:NAD(P)-binding domain-containing protein [Acidimicrobiales bacterium]